MTTVFLSYSRGDDEAFVRQLYDDLVAAGFDVWFDRVSLPSRRLSFHQEIKDALRVRDRLILVIGPHAAASSHVCEEWAFALACDKAVIPILRQGDFDAVPGELSLVHCEDFRDDAAYRAQFGKLVENLNRPEPPMGRLCGVPSLPPHFLGRPHLMRRIKDAVQVDLQKPIVITGASSRVGIQGMGGIGKSVLAAAVARDREIRRSYPDGVVWISIGQTPNVLALLQELARQFGDSGAFRSVSEAQGVLQQVLLDKAVLMILDDVWSAASAVAFDVLGPRCRALVTSRDAGVIHALNGTALPVELMSESEALSLLAATVDQPPDRLPAEALDVVRECGCLPLGIALCGGMAKKRSGDWGSVLQRLRNADLARIADREAINEQHRSIYRAMQISVEALRPDEQRRFAELSVFATDQTIPEAAVAALWRQTGGLDVLDTEDLLINLGERALVRLETVEPKQGGSSARRVSLHDLLFDYASLATGDPQPLHQVLLDAYRTLCPSGWASGPNDGYFFQNLCLHVVKASGDGAEAAKVLCDLAFIEAKVNHGMAFELVRDFHEIEGHVPSLARLGPEWIEWKQFVETEARNLDRYSGEYPQVTFQQAFNQPRKGAVSRAAQLLLAEGKAPGAPFIERVNRPEEFERLACLKVLEGHTDGVMHVVLTGDGRAVSASSDHTLRAWDLETGRCLQVFEGHGGAVTHVALTGDGRAVSASSDHTLRVWDLASGRCLRVLDGHVDAVLHVVLTGEGRAVSASGDFDFVEMWDFSGEGTLCVWDLATGRCLHKMPGHRKPVEHVALTGDGRIVSASADETLRVWDLVTGACLKILDGHRERVSHVVLTADGRAVSCSYDHALRIWDLATGQCLHVLEGHTDIVFVAALTDDGRIVSASMDKTLRVWDLATGRCLHVMQGHTGWVTDVALTTDGRAVSASDDHALRVWDLATGQCQQVFLGHTDEVNRVVLTGDGRAVSCSRDRTLRVWDLATGSRPQAGERDAETADRVTLTNDGRAVSTCEDSALRVWDLETGRCLHVLRGHAGKVFRVVPTGDGRAVSASHDHTLRVWDLVTGQTLHVLEGHRDCIWDLALTDDGRGVSASRDHTLRVWDLATGRCLHVLNGHTSSVEVVALTKDGRVLSSSSDRSIRVWDLGTGQCLRRIEGFHDHPSRFVLTGDGRVVSSFSWRGDSLLVWDLDKGGRQKWLEGHQSLIHYIDLTGDGRVVSASHDRTLRVWDLDSGRCLQVLRGHTDLIEHVDLTGDGRAVSAARDRTLRVWDLATGQCLETCPRNSTEAARWRFRCQLRAGGSGSCWSCDEGPVHFALSGECVSVYPGIHDRGGARPDARQGIFVDRSKQVHVLHLRGVQGGHPPHEDAPAGNCVP